MKTLSVASSSVHSTEFRSRWFRPNVVTVDVAQRKMKIPIPIPIPNK